MDGPGMYKNNKAESPVKDKRQKNTYQIHQKECLKVNNDQYFLKLPLKCCDQSNLLKGF